MSIRALARKFHHSRRKVREALKNPEPHPYTRQQETSAPVLGPFKPIIRQILTDDEQAPPKVGRLSPQLTAEISENKPKKVLPM